MVRVIDDFIKFTRPMNLVPLYCKWAMIALGSAMLSRRVYMHSDAFGYIYPTMYIIFVGRPGTGKTMAIDRACEWFLDDLPFPPNYAADCSSPAAFLEEFQRAYKDDVSGNADHSAVFVRANELTAWFQDIGGGTFTQYLLSFYDPMPPGKMWKKKLIRDGGNLEFPNPALTLFAATTPDHIKNSKLVESAGMGFISRCIFVCEPNWYDHIAGSPQLDQTLKQSIKSTFRNLMGMHGEFVYSEDAQQELRNDVDYKNEWMKEHLGETLFSHFVVRRDRHIRKTALIISALRNLTKIVTGEDIRDARTLIEELEENYMYAFGQRIKFNDEALWDRVITKMAPGKPVSYKWFVEEFEKDGQALPWNEEVRSVFKGMAMSGKIKILERDGETLYEKI